MRHGLEVYEESTQRHRGHREDLMKLSASEPRSPQATFTMGCYPSRIVCLTEETTETLYLLGMADRIVGVSGYTARPPDARHKPRVSAFTHANYDRIAALEPDLDHPAAWTRGAHRRCPRASGHHDAGCRGQSLSVMPYRRTSARSGLMLGNTMCWRSSPSEVRPHFSMTCAEARCST